MDLKGKLFYRKKINYEKLIPFGFSYSNNIYYYKKDIANGDFVLKIDIVDGKLTYKVFDKEFDDEYTLINLDKATGEFVGKLREEVKEVLKDIASKCFDDVLFTSDQANRIANYIYSEYKIEPDFPWIKYEAYGVFRNKDNNLWFGLIMDVPDNKLKEGVKGKTVINIKPKKELFLELSKIDGIYPGWHMNKKSWLSVSLDDTLPDEYIESLIDSSYMETLGKKKTRMFPPKK